DDENAVRLLREARTESPEHPVPPLILGQLALRLRQVKPAHELLEAAVSLPLPDNWPASHRQRFQVLLHSERLKLAQQLQDVDLTREALSQWMKADPSNRRLRTWYEELPPKPGAK
ncbi:MAG TPA: hypothetical protein VH120_17085, partial [Gemmataceae bacterium]|nr:hypothetical protein [Gemmataceae bacterium]